MLLDCTKRCPAGGTLSKMRGFGKEITGDPLEPTRSWLVRSLSLPVPIRRTRAAWIAALKSLELHALIEPTSPERHFYAVTDAGYRTSKRLGFHRWKTKEIKIAAYSVGRDSDPIMVPCSASLKCQPSITRTMLVETEGPCGVSRGISRCGSRTQIATFGWIPNAISFADERDQSLVFQIRRLPSDEDGGLLLEIPGGHRLKTVNVSD
jgi:hypothetical protein